MMLADIFVITAYCSKFGGCFIVFIINVENEVENAYGKR